MRMSDGAGDEGCSDTEIARKRRTDRRCGGRQRESGKRKRERGLADGRVCNSARETVIENEK